MWKKTAENKGMTSITAAKGRECLCAVSWHSVGVVAIAAFCAGLVCAIACRQAAGATLGYYFGPLVFAGLFVPALAQGTPTRAIGRGVSIALAFTAGVSIVWLFNGPATYHEVWLCAVLLFTVALFIAALASLLTRIVRSTRLGGGLAVIILLAWMTCPIWLSRSLASAPGERWVSPISSLQPVLAINGIMPELGIWTQQRVMYQLTTLGQDVSYALPATPWHSVLFHLLASVVLGGIGWTWTTISPDPLAPH
jgi:hypothetical protein